MKKSLGRILVVFFMLLAMGMTVCAVEVSDIKTNRIFQVNSDVELHEEPDTASAVTSTLPNGTPVIIREGANEGWCRVAYKENEGYMQISFLEIFGSPITPAATDGSTVAENEAVSNDGTAQNNGVQPSNETAQNSEVQPDADVPQEKDAQLDNEIAQDQGMQAEDEKTLDDEFRMIQEQNQRAYQEAEAAKKQAKSDRMWGSVIAVLVIAIFAVGIGTTLIGNKRKKKKQ